jgi:hypothetical protein
MVRREVYGNISMCKFPIDSYVNVFGVSVNGKLEVVYVIVFFFR